MKKAVFITLMIFCFIIFSGCDKENVNSNSKISQSPSYSDTKSLETLDGAIVWYLQKKESHKYSESEHFVFSYRILDTKELSDSVTVYIHILCEWISLDGEVVSGGAGLTSVTFKKSNDVYEYEKDTYYDGQQIPESSEIPQKVKDALANDSFDETFKEMRAEVDKDISDFLK